MKKVNKKTISIIVIIALVFSSYGCLELWGGIYSPIQSPISFMAIAAPVIFAYAYTKMMLYRRTGRAANLKNSSTALTAVISPPRETLLVWAVVMTLPLHVIFNGFNGTIGTYRIVKPDGSVRRTSNIISTRSDTAFVDLNDSGTHESQYEPGITYNPVMYKLTLSFPPWGGGREGTLGYDITDYGVWEFNKDIFSFPTYEEVDVDWTFTSVDPDTGGADDGQGEDPMVKTFSSTVMQWGGYNPGNILLLHDLDF